MYGEVTRDDLDSIRRDVGSEISDLRYEIDRLKDDIRSLERALEEERETRQSCIAELSRG